MTDFRRCYDYINTCTTNIPTTSNNSPGSLKAEKNGSRVSGGDSGGVCGCSGELQGVTGGLSLAIDPADEMPLSFSDRATPRLVLNVEHDPRREC